MQGAARLRRGTPDPRPLDIVTQGALGAALAVAAAPREEVRVAALAGLVAGLLADADVLISSGTDPLLALEYHRHFSHALIFIPLGALLAAALLWPLLRRRLAFARLYLYCLAGYSLSGLLDACTGYGTHLLWPFSDHRVAWNLISIVDPLFTLALLVPLAMALRTRRRNHAWLGIGLAALYLGVAGIQQHRAEDALRQVAEERGHAVTRLLVRPTFGNLVLWRGLYESAGAIHVVAIRAGPGLRVYEGAVAPRARVAHGSGQARFAALADGWLIAHPDDPGRVGDARYAMLPTALRPLWNVEPTPAGGLRLVTDRRLSRAERTAFLRMLAGDDP